MYLFCENCRGTLIAAVAVPVVLMGTFGVLSVLGYSINTLSMFAMVLAIGLLVDDAIVVVENVERVMSEEGLSPYEATRKSMGQITGALRSEEHTSELQSLMRISYAVFCLKTKTNKYYY